MTFNRILLRMFKANFRKYLLYFLCSSFAVMLLFTFNSLYTNPGFNDPSLLDGRISSNLMAPRWALIVFSVLFLLFAQSSLMKSRKAEFGLFMVLGMTRSNICRLILLENVLLALSSMAAGFLSGSLFMRIFYLLIGRIVDLDSIPVTFSRESYVETASFFGILYVLVIAVSMLSALQPGILSQLKSAQSADRPLLRGKLPGLTGVLLLAACLLSGWFIKAEWVFQLSMLLCWPALYLLLTGLGAWAAASQERKSSRRYRNLLFISDLKHRFVRFRNISFLITLLMTIAIFLSSLMLDLYFRSWGSAADSNPYSIAYAELYGKNTISPQTLQSITSSSQTELLASQSLEVLNMPHPKILSSELLNAVTGTDYLVERGSFLNLFLVADKSGYTRVNESFADYDAPVLSGKLHLVSAGTVERMLFNLIPVMGYHFLIVNPYDYEFIREDIRNGLGHIHLLQFADWRQTGDVDRRLNETLAAYNREHTEPWYNTAKLEEFAFKTSSRFAEYEEWKQSGLFGLIIMSFVGLIFYVSSCAVLHFGILSELEAEQRKYRKLYRIGMTVQEAEQQMKRPLRLIFFLPYILAALISGFIFCSLTAMLEAKDAADMIMIIVTALIVSALFILLQLLFYQLYTRRYVKQISTML
ncbi:FtsX-like permease family protein [Paenibacillus sp. FSL R7-0331]|uniref:FtsX-like permease family protein n=1 Tax=Paenibacillus sp. FSL R7-0331 TaxID=1536773 RepID=UPI0004F7A5CE|nr:ABC transporter permease [Paenibacillus sp. FSL R7-0331]AIQ53739.1 hypothetical protein R70331_20870 [Paenibacillus sp. FSL R7-0331]